MNTTAHTPEIDNVDLAILTLINNAKRPLWKNKIHERIHDDQDQLPITQGVSVQTVGRRVDNLQEEGYLETVIASPDDLKRDLIIAFDLTDDGHNILNRKQEAVLKDIVHESIFSEEKATEIGKHALISLVNDHFAHDNTQALNPADHTEREIIATLTLHYAEQEAMNVFGHDDQDTLYNNVSDNTVIPVPAAR